MKIKEFNDKTWEILQLFERESSLRKNLPIEWKKQFDSREDFHKDKNEWLSILELIDFGAIETRSEKIQPKFYEFAFNFDPNKDYGKILYVDILQPRFGEVYKEYRRHYQKKDTDRIKITNEIKEDVKYLEREKRCYLRLSDEEIEIGKKNTRKCKFLKSVSDPIGTAKSVDALFGDIQVSKDKSNQRLWDEYLGKTNKQNIIKGTIKELQRQIKSSKSKKRLKFNVKNNMVWVEVE